MLLHGFLEDLQDMINESVEVIRNVTAPDGHPGQQSSPAAGLQPQIHANTCGVSERFNTH